jgi:hypothetical protein
MKKSKNAEVALAAITTAMQAAQAAGDQNAVGELATAFYWVCAKDQGALG